MPASCDSIGGEDMIQRDDEIFFFCTLRKHVVAIEDKRMKTELL